jgi:Penicillin-insensitive murein endopeptidase
MGWRRGELWLDTELWPAERVPVPAFAGFPVTLDPSDALPPGLAASRRRREAREWDRRAQRSRASAIALSPALMFVLAALQADGRKRDSFVVEDPPSLTFRFDEGGLKAVESSAPKAKHARRKAQSAPTIAWDRATSVGLPYAGSLLHGTQLPVHGPDWVTWNPITDSAPNLPKRLYGNEHTIRTILSVTRAYRATHPHAPRVVIGDISREGGGPMDDHASHQNGLDVDVYFPRRDRNLLAPTSPSQINHRLAQDLLDRFVAAGAHAIFVGYSTGLRGPAGVVIPWPGHEYHMHVRFPPPG